MSEPTPLPLPEGLRWIKLVCRLGRLAHDGVDADDKPDLLPTAGKVKLASSPARLRVQETDGRWRSVSLDDREYTIRADGELVDTEGRVGVWIPDPASELLDPRPYTLVATVLPAVGERWAVKLTGETLPDVVDLVAHSETVAIPASAVPGLSSRIAALEGILADGGGTSPAGAVPIFETLAQAEAWEAANPGRIALTLEGAPLDTTAPIPGALGLTPLDTSIVASVSGASDDVALSPTPYSFRINSGAWTAWQADATYTATGLTTNTPYTVQHRVRDAAGNEAVGVDLAVVTLSEAPWGQLWSDDFAAADGTAVAGRAMPVAPSTTTYTAFSTSEPVINMGRMSGTTGSRPSWDNHISGVGGLIDLGFTPERVKLSVAWKSGPSYPEGIALVTFGASAVSAEVLEISEMLPRWMTMGISGYPPEGYSSTLTGVTSSVPHGQEHSAVVEIVVTSPTTVAISITLDGAAKATSVAAPLRITPGGWFGVLGKSANVTIDSWSIRAE